MMFMGHKLLQYFDKVRRKSKKEKRTLTGLRGLDVDD